VYSATGGYVLRVGENNLGGNIVLVGGAGGRRYYYAHLYASNPKLAFGVRVGTTTIIGYVGNTGNAEHTPPHLHLGIYTSEGPVNPHPLLVDQ
jgi:murein DD-endopeptidase MepM/ murein hydrolase activator NlpD